MWVWASILFSKFAPTVAGIALTAAGIAAAVRVGMWMDRGRGANEPRGFEVKPIAERLGATDRRR